MEQYGNEKRQDSYLKEESLFYLFEGRIEEIELPPLTDFLLEKIVVDKE